MGQSVARSIPNRMEIDSALGRMKVTNASSAIAWDEAQRVARVSYTAGAVLTSADGDFLAESLARFIGTSGAPFGVLADAAGLKGTDAEYRAKASGFFRSHRDHAFIALVNLGPVIHVVVELFRVGTGIQLKTFPHEAAAREWLRAKGIAA